MYYTKFICSHSAYDTEELNPDQGGIYFYLQKPWEHHQLHTKCINVDIFVSGAFRRPNILYNMLFTLV